VKKGVSSPLRKVFAYNGARGGESFPPYSKKEGTNRGGGKRASPCLERHL
jgi:hypothetical protein